MLPNLTCEVRSDVIGWQVLARLKISFCIHYRYFLQCLVFFFFKHTIKYIYMIGDKIHFHSHV